MELNEDRRSTTILVVCTSSTIYFDSNSAFGPLRDVNVMIQLLNFNADTFWRLKLNLRVWSSFIIYLILLDCFDIPY